MNTLKQSALESLVAGAIGVAAMYVIDPEAMTSILHEDPKYIALGAGGLFLYGLLRFGLQNSFINYVSKDKK